MAERDVAAADAFSWRELLPIAGFWLLVTSITVANWHVAFGSVGGRENSIGSLLLVATGEAAAWTAITTAVFRYLQRAGRTGGPRLATILGLGAAGVGVALAMGGLVLLLRHALDMLPPGVSIDRYLRPALSIQLAVALATYGGIVAAGLGRAHARQNRVRQAHAARLEAHAARLETQLAEAKLDALRRQLDPHFLFNTLNLIASLADSDPRSVRRLIARLSELLRVTLEDGDAAEVPLRQELAFVDRYLDIMRLRYGDRLAVGSHVDLEALDAMVPSLILQPLVENAIKYGVERVRGQGRVEIEGRCMGDTLVLRVCDNGPADDDGASQVEAATGTGVGLRNTVARLTQLYGSAAHFALTRGREGGTLAEVRLPLRKALTVGAHAVADGRGGHG